MSFCMQHDIGAFIKTVSAAALTSATAAGSGDATLVTGTSIDRLSKTFFPGGPPLSAVLQIHYSTTLASAATLTLGTVLVEHSADNTNWSTLSSAASGTVETGGSGGTTNVGVFAHNVNLQTAEQYVRCKFTPDLSRTGTDTATLLASFVFGGFAQLPNS